MNIVKLNKIVFLMIVSFGIFSCKNEAGKEKVEQSQNSEAVSENQEEKVMHTIVGNYVSDGYEKKDEGYDWVSVSVMSTTANELKIKVRSRADKKRPSCTFDDTARKQNDSTFTSVVDGSTILYVFDDKSLKIVPKKSESEAVLAFYCSGGATVAGTYAKIDAALDTSQIDRTLFNKVLRLQDIGFNISSIKEEGKMKLTVYPFGLELPDQTMTIEIEGSVIDAEIEDLNSDGSPEVLVFTRNQEEKGNVYGFSTNNKKSMSLISFPTVSENAELNKGYQGHDEFAIVETYLVQRFPIYENGKATDRTRQISYKLVEGEAMRRFKVDQVNEY